jgi:hypothetical protein
MGKIDIPQHFDMKVLGDIICQNIVVYKTQGL